MLLRKLIFWKIKPSYFLGMSHFKWFYLKLIVLIINVFWNIILSLSYDTGTVNWIININTVVVTFMEFIIYFVQPVQMSFADYWLSWALIFLKIGFVRTLNYIVNNCLNWLKFALFSFWFFFFLIFNMGVWCLHEIID